MWDFTWKENSNSIKWSNPLNSKQTFVEYTAICNLLEKVSKNKIGWQMDSITGNYAAKQV